MKDSRVKRFVIYCSTTKDKRRTLGVLIRGVEKPIIHPIIHGDKITCSFRMDVKSKKHGLYFLKKTAWRLSGSVAEVDMFLKEIKKDRRLTYDNVTLSLETFLGDSDNIEEQI